MPSERKLRPDVCDYEGSNYRTEFWENQGRDYEDRAERIALRRLLPRDGGKRLLEVGAGFGRLTEEYKRYEQVVLLDYSFSQLQYARERYGDGGGRYVYVAADAYAMPFRAGVFDGASMIRTIHHMSHVDTVLGQVHRVLAPGGVFILEHANKQNLKAVLRYRFKKQDWNPHDLTPIEFVELNYDFHPEYIKRALMNSGFEIQKRVPVSFFRVGVLKKNIPTGVLAALDGLMQMTGILYAPSVFVKCIAKGETSDRTMDADIVSLMVCPETGEALRREGDTLVSRHSGIRYAVREGIYDFKAPLE